MKQQFTIRCDHQIFNGFGCQLLDFISGIAYARVHDDLEYVHTPIENFPFFDKPEYQNQELSDSNRMLNEIMLKLGIKLNDYDNVKLIKYFFHKEIVDNGVDKYYTNEFLSEFANTYTAPPPLYFENNSKNIAIHIRRGDVLSRRFVDIEIYNEIIRKLRIKYPTYNIHVFSWGKVELNDSNICYHSVDTPYLFMEHFNAFVHADILVVGCSSLSVCAGFFNKNIVICSDDLFKSTDPYPTNWFKNYTDILEKNDELKSNFKNWGQIIENEK